MLITQTNHKGYKVYKQLVECFCPERAEEVWAQESGQLNDVGAGVWAATMSNSHVSGPFSGPPSSGSLYYLPLVYLVFKLKPYLRRPPQ